jgi:hypothetical protein
MNIFIAEDSEKVRSNLRRIQSDPLNISIVGIAVDAQGVIEHIGAIEHMAALLPDVVILIFNHNPSRVRSALKHIESSCRN